MWPDLWFGALGGIAWGGCNVPAMGQIVLHLVASGCVLGEGMGDSAGEPDRKRRVQRPRNPANHVASGCIRIHPRGRDGGIPRAAGATSQCCCHVAFGCIRIHPRGEEPGIPHVAVRSKTEGDGELLVGLDPSVDGDAIDAVRFGGAREG
jgi:hypothetical protein